MPKSAARKQNQSEIQQDLLALFEAKGTEPIPANEPDRLRALQDYDILDTQPEEAFDALTRLASYICQAPISLVSLIDSQRQWFKSKLGLEVPETPREVAFCRYAIMQGDVFEVPDALETPLFRTNPLVTGEAKIRFYAGAPLVTPEGYSLGTLCIIDTKPRNLTPEQKDALQILAREVVSHLELRRSKLRLAQERQKLEEVIRMANSSQDQVFAADKSTDLFIKHDGKLVKVNMPDILWIEALGDYVNVHTAEQRYTVHSSMKEIENRVSQRDFLRVHRGYIIRLDKISSIEDDMVVIEKKMNIQSPQWRNGLMYIPIGNSYKNTLMQRLNLL